MDELAPALTPQDWPEILSEVEEAMVPYLYGDALTPLIPHIPDELLGRALTIATSFPPDIRRAIALEKLAPRLPGAMAVAALAPAREITEPKHRADVLTALLPRLPQDVATPVRGGARTAVGDIDPPVDHGHPIRRLRWTLLIPMLPAEERASAIADRLPLHRQGPPLAEAVRDTGRLGYLARVLHSRAEHLSGAALEAGLTMARTTTGQGRTHQRQRTGSSSPGKGG